MIDIKEALLDVQNLSDYIAEHREEHIDEGLRDIINTLKRKFKQVVTYLSGLVAKLTGSYWLPVDDDGTVLPAISPLTAGQAYADGEIDKASTVVVMTSAGKRALANFRIARNFTVRVIQLITGAEALTKIFPNPAKLLMK